MSDKTAKPNTPEELERRVRKLERTVAVMQEPDVRDLWPNFSGNAVFDLYERFFTAHGISYERVSSREDSSISIYIAAKNQDQLDISERVLRLGNKALLHIRDNHETPTLHLGQMLRILTPFFRDSLLKYAGKISDIVGYDRNGNFSHTVFIEGFEWLAQEFEVPKLEEGKLRYKKGYAEALDRFLAVSKTYSSLYGCLSLSEERKEELNRELKRRAGYRGQTFRSPEFTKDYLEKLAGQAGPKYEEPVIKVKPNVHDGVAELILDFGVLVGVTYSGAAREFPEFHFVKDGNLVKHRPNLNGLSVQLKKFIINELVSLVEANHKAMPYPSNVNTALDKELDAQVKPYLSLLQGTRDSVKYLDRRLTPAA